MLRVMLEGSLEIYKSINLRDKGRDFFNINDMQKIKEDILGARKSDNISKIDRYYMYEMLQVYEYFEFFRALIKKYKETGFSSKLTEEYIDFSDEYSNRIEFYLARLLLTGDEQTALRILADNNIVSKDYNYERIDFLLNLYRDRQSISDDELYTLATHINLPSNSFSHAIEIYKRMCPERDKEDVIKMYRDVFSRNSKDNTKALEIINSEDKQKLVHEYIKNGIDDRTMKLSVANIKGSTTLSLTDEESSEITKFGSMFRDEYRKLYPVKEEKGETKKAPKMKVSLEDAKEEMWNYEHSGYKTKVGYCKNNNVKIDYFKECMRVLENAPIEEEDLKKKNIKELCAEIAFKLENGIEENGIIRDFDMIDFYIISPYLVSELQEKLTKERGKNIEIVKKFLSDKHETRYGVVPMKKTMNCKKDSFGNLIQGTGQTIEIEDSKKCIEYLKEISIEANNLSYNDAMLRFLNGYISFDEKVKVK